MLDQNKYDIYDRSFDKFPWKHFICNVYELEQLTTDAKNGSKLTTNVINYFPDAFCR